MTFWPYDRLPLIQAMEQACDLIQAASVQGWIRHTRRFFQRCLANEDIACDVDEILWPDPARWRDSVLLLLLLQFFFRVAVSVGTSCSNFYLSTDFYLSTLYSSKKNYYFVLIFIVDL